MIAGMLAHPRTDHIFWFTDEFKAARDMWNGGAIDNFNSFGDNDWTYSAVNSCGATGNGTLLKNTETEIARRPGALLAEADEAGVLGA